MVLKQKSKALNLADRFESSVNSDGTQTYCFSTVCKCSFESSVNSDGTQTLNEGKRY